MKKLIQQHLKYNFLINGFFVLKNKHMFLLS